jgi:hypothetical protein
MKELKRFQIMRQIEQNDADQQHNPSPSLRNEAATRPAEKNGDVKKQTQYASALMDVTSFVKGDYGNIPAGRVKENKANQSQFHVPAMPKGAGKREKSVAAATG